MVAGSGSTLGPFDSHESMTKARGLLANQNIDTVLLKRGGALNSARGLEFPAHRPISGRRGRHVPRAADYPMRQPHRR